MLSTLCVRATFKNQNEDSIFVKEKNGVIKGCIADGCSTGIHSAFASRLICYLFEKNCHNTGNFCMETVIRELKFLADVLSITEQNLLATFIPFFYDIDKEELNIRVLGDGVYYVNGERVLIEQNNTPDYIGYQINEGFAGNTMFLDKYPTITYRNVRSFSVCSDGITSFEANQFEPSDIKPEEFLINCKLESENILERKYNILKKKKFTNRDDVSIISYATT